jgi:SAM-dependent methyltransferase
VSTRWHGSDAPRGDEYDARWRTLAAQGANVHGEADLVEALLRDEGGTRVLDAGCGTGRVAIELARRGFSVVGVDADAPMLAAARAKAPEICWLEGDLADLSDLPGVRDDEFDLIVLAGNVMIFLHPGTEGRVLGQLTGRLAPGGLMVAGFQLRRGRISPAEYDRLAEAAGLTPVARWSTWDRQPFVGGDYAVSVHQR